MSKLLTYIFYPNPGQFTYASAEIQVGLALCAALVLSSFGVRMWRARLTNSVTKKLSRAWSSVLFWFGVVGIVLLIARVEKIQFFAMRFAWVLWGIAFLLILFLQYKVYRARHYEVMPRAATPDDPRAKYLPGKKK